MKITDDYKAKYRLWAENPRIVPPGTAMKLPDFKGKKFRSHEEMNRWKKSLILQAAQPAGK